MFQQFDDAQIGAARQAEGEGERIEGDVVLRVDGRDLEGAGIKAAPMAAAFSSSVFALRYAAR